MAKGNMLNGTVKGRIGNAVYYVKQGEQNIVKYNKEVANPRTGRQMYQRARFSNAGRFFTHGRQNYFKFAFEGKKISQSDFNAFIKANISRSVLISRSALQLGGYPAIGKFIMSQGSLQPVQCRVVNDYWQAAFDIAMPEGGINTIGKLSRALISTGNYKQGDILTFVFIWTSGSAYIPSAQPMGTANTTWHLKQFILNTTDSTPLSNYEMRAVSRVWDNTPLLTLTDLEDSQILGTSYSGFCCVHSRNTRSGLKVSTQELALGESMEEAYEYAQTSEYIDSVIADWQSTGNITYSPDAILKGSLSYSASPVTGITLAEVAGSQWQLSGNTFYTEEEIYPFNLLTPAAIMGVGVVPGMFQADNINGDAAAYVSFVQAAPNQVDVHIDSTSLPARVYAVRIYMMKVEQRIPICNIVWTSVTGEMEIEPFRLDTENWSINGNTLSLNTPYDSTGERFVIGFDSPDELSAENFSAEKTSGGDGTSMRFAVVDDEIHGAINVLSNTAGTYSYNVYYTHDGNKQLVAIVNFEVAPTSVAVADNERTIAYDSQDSKEESFFINPRPQLQVGDTLQVNFKLKAVGAVNSWECSFRSQQYTAGATNLYAQEVGQNVFEQGWLRYEANTHCYVSNGYLNNITFDLFNTTSTNDEYILTIQNVTIQHADGSSTHFDMSSDAPSKIVDFKSLQVGDVTFINQPFVVDYGSVASPQGMSKVAKGGILEITRYSTYLEYTEMYQSIFQNVRAVVTQGSESREFEGDRAVEIISLLSSEEYAEQFEDNTHRGIAIDCNRSWIQIGSPVNVKFYVYNTLLLFDFTITFTS